MIKVIDNFLNKDECLTHIQNIKTKKNKIPFNDFTDVKTDKYIDEMLVTYFYTKLLDIDPDIKDIVVCPNNLIMTAIYNPGVKFGLHTDTGLYYSKSNGLKSKYTVLIYLNDDFEGGHTIFYNEKMAITHDIEPKIGKCIIFDMDLFHEGLIVTKGQKIWISFELISKIEDSEII